MTIDEKVRYGIMALAGTSAILATVGLHLSPLDVFANYGD
jgi:hypothetical protein